MQNKLHRNAGPEDLVATETMLKRITSDGSFNPSFVAEFKKFRDELRDFFNAATFTSMLESLRPAFEGSEIQVRQARTQSSIIAATSSCESGEHMNKTLLLGNLTAVLASFISFGA